MLYCPRILRFLTHIPGIPYSFISPFSQLTPHVKTVSFQTHSSICNHSLMHFFAIGLTQLSTATLTHVLCYRPFFTNGIYYINKMSHYHIKKNTFAQLFQFWITIFSPLFIHVYWKVDITSFQEGREFMTSISTYLRPVSSLIQFTLCQHYSWTWRHISMNQLVLWILWSHLHAKPSAHL